MKTLLHRTQDRIALQYVLLFAITGVSLPFAGLWLSAQGLDGARIGLLLATPMLARVVTGPAIAVWADGFRYRRTAIAILSLISAAGYGGAGAAAALFDAATGAGLFALTLCWLVGATATAAIIPLLDVLNLRMASRLGFSFAFPRGCGSAVFVCVNAFMGAMLMRASVEIVVIWIAAAGVLGAFAAAWVLPSEPVSEAPMGRKRDRFRGIGRLVADRTFMTALFAIGAVQAAHAFYYGFSAIAWKAQGVGESMTGLLWAFSVVIEVAFMWWFEPWRRRRGIGAWAMLMIGAGAAILRWSLMALAPPFWALWPLQALHALTFAATYLAGVEIVQRLSPPDSQTSAQTLNSVLAAGVLIGVATLTSGPLYDHFGVLGYLAMTLLAGLGALAGLSLRGVLRS